MVCQNNNWWPQQPPHMHDNWVQLLVILRLATVHVTHHDQSPMKLSAQRLTIGWPTKLARPHGPTSDALICLRFHQSADIPTCFDIAGSHLCGYRRFTKGGKHCGGVG